MMMEKAKINSILFIDLIIFIIVTSGETPRKLEEPLPQTPTLGFTSNGGNNGQEQRTLEVATEEQSTETMDSSTPTPTKPSEISSSSNPHQPIIISPPWVDGISLLDAVQMGNLEAVKYRVSTAGDNLTAENDDGPGGPSSSAPIHTAAANGDLPILKYLVEEAGVATNSTNRDGETPLHSGAKGCHLDVIQYLVGGMGAEELSPKDERGYTPLHTAVEFNCVKVIRYLLDQRAELASETEPGSGDTPLHLAARGENNIQTVAALVDGGAPLEAKNGNGRTPLHAAVVSSSLQKWHPNRINMIKYLIARGADVKTEDADGNALLDNDRLQDNWEASSLVEYLLESGAELNPRVLGYVNFASPLGQSVLNSWRKCSSAGSSTTTTPASPSNLQKGVPLEYKYMDLDEAIRSGDLDAVRYLVSAGDNSSAVAYYCSAAKVSCSFNPIHAAVESGNLEMVKYFVEEAGVDANAHHYSKDNPHATNPLHVSMTLFSHFTYAKVNYSMEVVRYLVANRGANLSATDSQGKSALHLAARGAYLEPVQLLIEAGADVNAKDERGRTPLHEAAERRALHIAYYLVEHGASLNARDEDGLTPLASLVTRGKGNLLPLLKYLVRSGADTNVQFRNTESGKVDKIADYRITVKVSDLLREAGQIIFRSRAVAADDVRGIAED